MAFTFDYQRPLKQVFDKLIDQQFMRDRYLALGDIDLEVSVKDDGDRVSVTLNRLAQSDVPSILKKVMGAEQKLNIIEVWQRDGSAWSGTSNTDIVGTPLSISATMTLKPAAHGCRFSMSYRCKANVPLIGGKLEKVMAVKFEEELTKDHGYTANAIGA